MSVCLNRTSVKIDRSSYRYAGYPVLLPMVPPQAPSISPSQLAQQIADDLAAIRELGARQDALKAQLRRARWSDRVDAIYSGIDA
jgi:hypothetical protein